MKYTTPEVALMALEAKDVITSSTSSKEEDDGSGTLPDMPGFGS